MCHWANLAQDRSPTSASPIPAPAEDLGQLVDPIDLEHPGIDHAAVR